MTSFNATKEAQEFEKKLVLWSAREQEHKKPMVCDECRLHLRHGEQFFYVTDREPLEHYATQFFSGLPIAPSKESGIELRPAGGDQVARTFEYYKEWFPDIYDLWGRFYEQKMQPMFICANCSDMLQRRDDHDPIGKAMHVLALAEVVLRCGGGGGATAGSKAWQLAQLDLDNEDDSGGATPSATPTSKHLKRTRLGVGLGSLSDWDLMYQHLFQPDSDSHPWIYSLDQQAIDKWLDHPLCVDFLRSTCHQVVDIGACTIILSPAFLRKLVANPHEIVHILGDTKTQTAKKTRIQALTLVRGHVFAEQKKYVDEQSRLFPQIPVKNFWKDAECQSLGHVTSPCCKVMFQSPHVNWEIENWSQLLHYFNQQPEAKEFVLATGILKSNNPHLPLLKKFQNQFLSLHAKRILGGATTTVTTL